MKKYLSVVAIFSFLLMAIPSLSLVNSDNPEIQNASESTTTFITTENVTEVPVKNTPSFKMLETATGKILEIPEKDYIIGAVLAEMPASFEEEALKAQAVAVHTYAIRRHLSEEKSPTSDLNGADFSDNPNKYQAYFSEEEAKEFYGDKYSDAYEKVSAAVQDVYTKVLIYEGEPIIAAFHSTSSGRTESASAIWGNELPYLVSVESEGDKSAPLYKDKKEFTAEEVSARLTAKFENIRLPENKAEWLKISSRTEGGTVTAMKIGDTTITGGEFRSIFSLRSANFEISPEGEKFIIKTRGYGHGVGLSQYGANAMAKDGRTYDEILKHYYKGAEIAENSDFI